MIEIESIEALRAHRRSAEVLEGVVLQGLDLREHSELLGGSLADVVFLGCRLEPAISERAFKQGAIVFPPLDGLPFQAYRPKLYTVPELYAGFDPEEPETYAQTLDARVYQHWLDNGGPKPGTLMIALAHRLHDHAMTDALDDFLSSSHKKVVGIMGGHALSRIDPAFRQVAEIARALSRAGFLIATGGGPGAMEAAHLGCWLAGQPNHALDDAVLDEALALLAPAPDYKHPRWLAAAFQVRQRFPLPEPAPEVCQGIAIPTWHYGHEPPNAFATHIAKYFANSIREDGLISIARYGIIFAPGSAGTIQEIFQDACQNHYNTLGVISPMVLLGEAYWAWKKPVFPLLAQMAAGRDYARLITSTDKSDEAIEAIVRFAREYDQEAPL